MSGSAGWWRSSATANETDKYNKTQTQPKDKGAKSTGQRKIGGEIIVIQKIRRIICTLLQCLCFSYSLLARKMKTPRGGGCGGSGYAKLEELRERVAFPARSLGEDAAVLRSEHPFSDWLPEGAQGSGWRHETAAHSLVPPKLGFLTIINTWNYSTFC